MRKFSWWCFGVGAALLVVGVVGAHFLQYLIDPDLAGGLAALMGVLAGSTLVQGLVVRIKEDA